MANCHSCGGVGTTEQGTCSACKGVGTNGVDLRRDDGFARELRPAKPCCARIDGSFGTTYCVRDDGHAGTHAPDPKAIPFPRSEPEKILAQHRGRR